MLDLPLDHAEDHHIKYAYQASKSDGSSRSISGGCSHDQAYLSIVITVLPLWAMLTTILVFIMIQYHRSNRATKIYDNCNKASALYVYHLELRTGDTSATYNRRRASITVDMFDDNQNTLARITIPGHVIFGRRENPISPVLNLMSDNERFSELRCVRLWLYRAVRLKKVNTIRITHSCLEQDARIMIYGLQIRSVEADRKKQFFPIAHYISAYGSMAKPNASFDCDPTGSISYLGGKLSDQTSMLGEQLTFVDYALSIFIFLASNFYLSTYDFPTGSFENSAQASHKGVILGVVCFLIIFAIALVIKYIIRRGYDEDLGTGVWSYIYFGTYFIIICLATTLWIYTAIIGYQICTYYYNYWLISICVAIAVGFGLFLMTSLASWLAQVCLVGHPEPYLIPDELLLDQPQTTNQQTINQQSISNKVSKHLATKQQLRSIRQQQSIRDASQQQQQQTQAAWPVQQQQPANFVASYGPHQNLYATGAAQQHTTFGTPITQHVAMISPTNNATPTTPVLPTTYKTTIYHGQQQQQLNMDTQYPGNNAYVTYQNQPSSPPQLGTTTTTAAAVAAIKSPTYHQQTQMPTNTTGQATIGGGIKATKKIGSNESTGSTYYQQLMKNKGGVKSISQYGELMKQQKRAQKKQ